MVIANNNKFQLTSFSLLFDQTLAKFLMKLFKTSGKCLKDFCSIEKNILMIFYVCRGELGLVGIKGEQGQLNHRTNMLKLCHKSNISVDRIRREGRARIER